VNGRYSLSTRKQTAPDASLRDLDGNDATLHAIVAEKPTVLIFYRGSWCLYCDLHLSVDLESSSGQTTTFCQSRQCSLSIVAATLFLLMLI
jgi:peroxiredoxin